MPKKKAQQLVDSMAISTSYGTNYTGGDDIPMYKNVYAKECAIKVVNEIMDELTILPYGLQYLNRVDYWEQVKKEINKL